MALPCQLSTLPLLSLSLLSMLSLPPLLLHIRWAPLFPAVEPAAAVQPDGPVADPSAFMIPGTAVKAVGPVMAPPAADEPAA